MHYPTPAEAAEAERQALLERLVRPEELARMLVPQRRKRVVVPVWRTGRRGGWLR
jgi:hypothetical protein